MPARTRAVRPAGAPIRAESKPRVPAVAHAIAILRYLRDAPPDRATAAGIARALGLNRSSAYNILRTLEADLFVTRNPASHQYELGPTLAELGSRSSRTPADYAAHFLERVRATWPDLEYACIVAQPLPNDTFLVIDKLESRQPIKVTVEVGERFPATAAALGKAYLAWLPQAVVERVLAGPLPAYTPTSITDPERFKEELARVRRLGYSESRREYYPGNNAVASPIFGPAGDVVLVACVLGFAEDLTDVDLPGCGARLRDITAEVTRAIGGLPPCNTGDTGGMATPRGRSP